MVMQCCMRHRIAVAAAAVAATRAVASGGIATHAAWLVMNLSCTAGASVAAVAAALDTAAVVGGAAVAAGPEAMRVALTAVAAAIALVPVHPTLCDSAAAAASAVAVPYVAPAVAALLPGALALNRTATYHLAMGQSTVPAVIGHRCPGNQPYRNRLLVAPVAPLPRCNH